VSTERLFGWRHAFDAPLTVGLVIGIAAVLLSAPAVFAILGARGRLTPEIRKDLWARYLSWTVLAVVIVIPILLGAAWLMLAVLALSVFCQREFARVTGSGGDKPTHVVVLIGIVAVAFASVDNWYRLFVALYPLTISLVAMVAVLPDRPQGYIQRVALAAFAFMLFGGALGHVAFLGNDWNYRPLVLFLLVAVELNDVFAYTCGRLFGRRKLIPHTSPNKTLAGALGALVLTTVLTLLLGRVLFAGTALDHTGRLLLLGVILSLTGQVGDLVMSSVKRDLGIKDAGRLMPGMGGLLDRFDSLIFAAPAFFHYVNYLVGVGQGQPINILTVP